MGGAAGAGWRAEGASNSWVTLRAASVVGVRHRLAGQASDDSFAWASTDDVLAVAVSDGIGSVPGSAEAAERAARAAVGAAVVAAEPHQRVRSAFEAAGRAAAGGGATTLVVALVTPDGAAALGRVGDSTAFLVDADGGWEELFDPPDPDRADTATAALPGDDDPAVRTVRLVPGDHLVLLTDGIADPWRDGPTTVAPALVQTIVAGPEPAQLLVAADFSRQGCHDDRTVAVLWLR